MHLIFAWRRWPASALQRLSCWLLQKLLWTPATRPKTTPASTACAISWRPLTANSSAAGACYRVARRHSPDAFLLYVHDTRTQLTWLCRFSSQHLRNAYLQDLRTGRTNLWPDALLDGPGAVCFHPHLLP